MPELPEVETVRLGLAPVMEGAAIVRADIRRADLRWRFPEAMAARLAGARVLRLRRRAKYILADLSSDETLLVHLGMSGRMLITVPEEAPPASDAAARAAGAGDVLVPGRFHFHHPAPARHDHVILDMDNGARITFNDSRRFGAMDLCATAALDGHRLLAGLGPEPLGNGFDAVHLAARFAGRRMPVKAALLDQRIVAGLGNIYVCEALHRAGIAPRRAAGRIAAPRLERLVAAIRAVLAEAIEAGGSSLRDHRRADGDLGYFQHGFRAYDRAGSHCPTPGCAGTIRRIVQGGRSTFWCGRCQR